MNGPEAFEFNSPEIIGRRFQWFRTNSELSPEALAEELGRPVSFIHDVESGKQVPDEPVLTYLEKTYGLDCNWLLTGHSQSIPWQGYKGGLPPGDVKAFLKKAGIPFKRKKDYAELLKLLQVPEVWTFMTGYFTEFSILSRWWRRQQKSKEQQKVR